MFADPNIVTCEQDKLCDDEAMRVLQVQALLRVSKTNFVVMKLLVGGHKKDSVVRVG